MANGALYVSSSQNHKIGAADATYLAIRPTCPSSCALRERGCYAQDGKVELTVRRLETEAAGGKVDPDVAEVEAIDAATPHPNRPLRLHVSGDVTTIDRARALGAAIARWLRRGGPVAWTYTHAWKAIPRKAFSPISVLASVDRVEDLPLARKRGYAPAIVVPEHWGKRAFEKNGIKWIPCPAQTLETVTCTSCKLCFDADALFARKVGIAFEAHGSRRHSISRRIVSLPLFPEKDS
jgi:hypothetical protein